MVSGSTDDRIAFEARLCPICKRAERQQLVRDANIDFERLNAASFSSRKLPEYMHCRLVKCGECSLVYASPAPTPAFLATSYRDASFDATSHPRDAVIIRFCLPSVAARGGASCQGLAGHILSCQTI